MRVAAAPVEEGDEEHPSCRRYAVAFCVCLLRFEYFVLLHAWSGSNHIVVGMLLVYGLAGGHHMYHLACDLPAGPPTWRPHAQHAHFSASPFCR